MGKHVLLSDVVKTPSNIKDRNHMKNRCTAIYGVRIDIENGIETGIDGVIFVKRKTVGLRKKISIRPSFSMSTVYKIKILPI